MNRRYLPRSLRQSVGHVIEETGEVLAAAGKSIRWGLGSSNPELPPELQETNANWLLRELADLRFAVGHLLRGGWR